MTKTRALLLAARPKTLPAAIAPVITGSALAWRLEYRFSWLLAAATLLSTIAIQIATNYFNDAVDAKKGADTAARLGPVRATAASLVSRRAMMAAGVVAGLAAVGFSLPLVMERGWPIVVIGIVSLFFSYGYTGGPWPLAYRGLGELFVILFFGLVAVTGTVYVQTGQLSYFAGFDTLTAGLQIGFLSTALIGINNLRDIEEDTQSGKRTMAVRGGMTFARVSITLWCILPYMAGLLWLGSTTLDPRPDSTLPGYARLLPPALSLAPLFWVTLPGLLLGLVIAGRVWTTPPSAAYNRILALAGLHLIVWTALFTIACLWFPAG